MKDPKTIPCAITISRPQGGRREPCISVKIEDHVSGIQFIEANFSLSSFMEALTGLGCVDGSMEVRGLEYVGLKRVSERRKIHCPLSQYTERAKLETWLAENGQEEGWLVSTYLGSQQSISSSPEGLILNYHVTKYIQTDTP